MVIGVWQPTWLSQLSFEGPTVYPLDGFKNQYPMVIWIHYGTMGSKPMANGIVEQRHYLTIYWPATSAINLNGSLEVIPTWQEHLVQLSLVFVCKQPCLGRCATAKIKNNVCMFQAWRNDFNTWMQKTKPIQLRCLHIDPHSFNFNCCFASVCKCVWNMQQPSSVVLQTTHRQKQIHNRMSVWFFSLEKHTTTTNQYGSKEYIYI